MSRWNMLSTDADLALMSRVLGVSEITASVLANRGLRSKKTALSYLNPAMNALRDVYLMKDAERAIGIIIEAIDNRQKLMIYGDYDADGIMGTVILYKALTAIGADADFSIPRRVEEGYGLNREAVKRIKNSGCELLIAVDNGISAADEVKLANELGMRVIIIDHHEPGPAAPEAAAVIDPKQPDCTYPFKQLCAAGLSYKLAAALLNRAGAPDGLNGELLALAAVATVCDIVELKDENRVIVRNGLETLNRNKRVNQGLYSLIAVRGYADKPLDAFAAGFVLGPCINATGRLESAELSVRLLLSSEADECERLARKLAALNDERKNITQNGVNRMLELLSGDEKLDKVLVLSDGETHESVAGIVAGRIKDVFHRPVIMLTRAENGELKGSGRSIPGYNLFEALNRHRELFTRFGGHSMAAGLTLPAANAPILREYLNNECTLTDDDFIPKTDIDREIAADEVTLALARELETLAPFGSGNPEPLFLTRGLAVEYLRAINEKNTLLFTFLTGSGRRLKAVAFGLNDAFMAALDGGALDALKHGRQIPDLHMDIVYAVEINVYNNNASAQARVRDFKII